MKKVVIIDDEKDARQAIHTLLNTYCPEVQICGEADSVESAYVVINQCKPNCILLDISMEDGSGFDLLDKFSNPDFQIIFITAHDEFALKAFKYHAFDYLLKPIQVEELINAMNRIKTDRLEDYVPRIQSLIESSKTKNFDKITLSSMEGLIFVTVLDIIQLESSGSYTSFHMVNKEKHVIARPMKDFENILPKSTFYKIHQSHIVNLTYVNKILREDGGYVLMNNGMKIPIARRRKEDFLEILKQKFSSNQNF